MGFSEDEPDGGSGPPPDPTLRAWRHPSEIAAAARAAADAGPQQPTRWFPGAGPVAFTVGLVTVGVLVATTLMTASGTMTDRGDTAAGAVEATTTTGPATRPDEPTTASTVAGQSLSGTSIISTSTPTSAPDPAATSGPSALDGSGNPDGRLPDPDEAIDGIYGRQDGSWVRLAAFLVVDGMVMTSDSATSGHDELHLLVGEAWVEATVRGRDPMIDLVLLELDDEGRDQVMIATEARWALPDDGPVTEPGTPVVVTVVGADGEPIESGQGLVVGADQEAVSQNGSTIYGSITITARHDAEAVGAPVVDDDGDLVAVVIDSIGPYLSAIPIDAIVDVGRSLLEWGVPALEWLGIGGSTAPDGGVALETVVDGGPADTADLRPGDVVLAVEGEPVEGWNHFVHLVRRSDVGSTISLTIVRDGGEAQTVLVTIGRHPDQVADD